MHVNCVHYSLTHLWGQKVLCYHLGYTKEEGLSMMVTEIV